MFTIGELEMMIAITALAHTDKFIYLAAPLEQIVSELTETKKDKNKN